MIAAGLNDRIAFWDAAESPRRETPWTTLKSLVLNEIGWKERFLSVLNADNNTVSYFNQ